MKLTKKFLASLLITVGMSPTLAFSMEDAPSIASPVVRPHAPSPAKPFEIVNKEWQEYCQRGYRGEFKGGVIRRDAERPIFEGRIGNKSVSLCLYKVIGQGNCGFDAINMPRAEAMRLLSSVRGERDPDNTIACSLIFADETLAENYERIMADLASRSSALEAPLAATEAEDHAPVTHSPELIDAVVDYYKHDKVWATADLLNVLLSLQEKKLMTWVNRAHGYLEPTIQPDEEVDLKKDSQFVHVYRSDAGHFDKVVLESDHLKRYRECNKERETLEFNARNIAEFQGRSRHG